MSHIKKQKVSDGAAATEDTGRAAQLEAIKSVQQKLTKIEDSFDLKVIEVQAEFNKQRLPLYQERSLITKQLNNFWYHAFANHPSLEMLLHSSDEEIFKQVTDLTMVENPDIKSGFKITVILKKDNTFFDSSELWKEFTFTEDGEPTVTQSGVKWKAGKNPSEGEKKKKRSRTDKSFFSFFEDITPEDLDIATFVKDDLWPDPLGFYLGESVDDDDDDEDDEEGEESEGEEGEDEEDEDDDDDEDEDADEDGDDAANTKE